MAGPRIRTVKPEWLEDEHLLRAGSHARVLSVALILVADDYGRGRCIPEALAAQVFPFEQESSRVFRESLARLSAMEFVGVYRVRDQQYFEIRNWTKHQRVDKPGKPRVPAPNANDFIEIESSGDSREVVARHSGDSRETLAPDLDLDRDLDQELEPARAHAIPVLHPPGVNGHTTHTTATAAAAAAASQNFTGRALPNLTSADVAAEWQRVGKVAWQALGLKGVLYQPHDAHRKHFTAIAAGLRELEDPGAALANLLDYFWNAPHGPVRSGRVQNPAPSLLVEHITRDLAEAIAWRSGVARATSQPLGNGTYGSTLRPEYQPFPELEEIPK